MAQSGRNMPFESRYQPSKAEKRRSNQKKSTLGDRLVCAFCGAVLSFLIWTACYGLMAMRATKAALRGRGDLDAVSRFPSFWWGLAVALVAAVLSAWAGEERMMDVFAVGARFTGRLAGFRRRD